MHGLHQRRTAGHILDETAYTHAILGGDAVHTTEVLVHIVADLGVLQVGLGGHGDDAAADILRQTVDLIDQLGDVVLAHVGQQRIDEVRAGGGALTLAGAG